MEKTIFIDEKTALPYQMIIGIETHVQILSNSKAFCSCENRYGGIPNSRTCPICLALPGSHPSVNKRLFEAAILASLAFNSSIAKESGFVRKNYNYPDLPKGYQITQNPQLSKGGYIQIEVAGQNKKIALIGLHMEEDVGKSLSIEDGTDSTYIDYNRSGAPLIEIVSAPEISSPEEASAYAQSLREIVRYLSISNGDMEEGSLRCDANINLKIEKDGVTYTTPISEVKNMNSFRHIKSALIFEARRHIDQWIDDGITIDHPQAVKTTRRWDDKKGQTIFMRQKGIMDDYRFLPEPDLKVTHISDDWIKSLSVNIKELPLAMRQRFTVTYGLSDSDCQTLTSSRSLAEYYEEAAILSCNPKKVANWILTELLATLNSKSYTIDQTPISPSSIAILVNMIEEGKITGSQAKDIFAQMVITGDRPDTLVSSLSLIVTSDLAAIDSLANAVIKENPQSVADYCAGKDHALKYLMGQLMKKSKGTAKADVASNLLKAKLNSIV